MLVNTLFIQSIYYKMHNLDKVAIHKPYNRVSVQERTYKELCEDIHNIMKLKASRKVIIRDLIRSVSICVPIT